MRKDLLGFLFVMFCFSVIVIGGLSALGRRAWLEYNKPKPVVALTNACTGVHVLYITTQNGVQALHIETNNLTHHTVFYNKE